MAIRGRLETQGKVIGGGLRAKLIARPKTELDVDPEQLAEALCSEGVFHGDVAPEIAKLVSSLDERKLAELLDDLEPPERAKAEAVVERFRSTFDAITYVDVRPIAGAF